MALSRLKTWVSEILTASDLNGEFNNILNNALSLISPLTGNLDFGGNILTGLGLGTVSTPAIGFTGNTNTGVYSRTADTVNVTAGGVLAAEFGITPIIAFVPEGSRTATVVAPEIRATTSGTPAAGIGTGILFTAESGDESPSNFGQIEFAASDVTAASEDTYAQLLLRVAGAALISCYRFAATGAFNAIFTHANTAARTYTLQDSSDTIVGRATTDTLTNKTITAAVVGTAGGSAPVANVLYTDSLIKGWCLLEGATWTIAQDLNVTSTTDNGVGDVTVTWQTDFIDNDYAVVVTAVRANLAAIAIEDTTTAKTVGVVRLNVFNLSAAAIDVPLNVIAIGNQS